MKARLFVFVLLISSRAFATTPAVEMKPIYFNSSKQQALIMKSTEGVFTFEKCVYTETKSRRLIQFKYCKPFSDKVFDQNDAERFDQIFEAKLKDTASLEHTTEAPEQVAFSVVMIGGGFGSLGVGTGMLLANQLVRGKIVGLGLVGIGGTILYGVLPRWQAQVRQQEALAEIEQRLNEKGVRFEPLLDESGEFGRSIGNGNDELRIFDQFFLSTINAAHESLYSL